jgi:hypothetical protein
MACLLAAFLASREATATAASCWQVEDAVENLLPSEAWSRFYETVLAKIYG